MILIHFVNTDNLYMCYNGVTYGYFSGISSYCVSFWCQVSKTITINSPYYSQVGPLYMIINDRLHEATKVFERQFGGNSKNIQVFKVTL